jgi:hypothetical protein
MRDWVLGDGGSDGFDGRQPTVKNTAVPMTSRNLIEPLVNLHITLSILALGDWSPSNRLSSE